MVATLFLEERPLAEHVAGIRTQREVYVVTALWNISKGITMTQSTKVRVLSAAWGAGEREMASVLLGYGDAFTVPVVLGAIQLLDSNSLPGISNDGEQPWLVVAPEDDPGVS